MRQAVACLLIALLSIVTPATTAYFVVSALVLFDAEDAEKTTEEIARDDAQAKILRSGVSVFRECHAFSGRTPLTDIRHLLHTRQPASPSTFISLGAGIERRC